jgi:hypothetical protein
MMPVIQLTVPGSLLFENLTQCSSMLKMSAHGKRSSVMRKFMLVATIASLSIVNASFAQAQAAIGEPGLYAFYHPDGDVLRAGSGHYGSRAEPRNAMASATVRRPARGHKQGRTQ